MKSYNQIDKQIRGLVRGIRQCNYIPNIEKEEIVQNSWVKVIQKMNEGILEDDYDKIKGYVFLIVRNFCNAYHLTKNRMYYTDELREGFETPNIVDNMDRDKLHQILLKHIQDKKFNDRERMLLDSMLNNDTEDEIRQKLQLKAGEMAPTKIRMIDKLNTSINRKFKYVLKRRNDEDFKIKFYSRVEIYNYFGGKFSRTYVMNSIKKDIDIGDYYVIKNPYKL
jgi:DNA-directed RNA polymerase specialized sigma24 family protein